MYSTFYEQQNAFRPLDKYTKYEPFFPILVKITVYQNCETTNLFEIFHFQPFLKCTHWLLG